MKPSVLGIFLTLQPLLLTQVILVLTFLCNSLLSNPLPPALWPPPVSHPWRFVILSTAQTAGSRCSKPHLQGPSLCKACTEEPAGFSGCHGKHCVHTTASPSEELFGVFFTVVGSWFPQNPLSTDAFEAPSPWQVCQHWLMQVRSYAWRQQKKVMSLKFFPSGKGIVFIYDDEALVQVSFSIHYEFFNT